MLASAGEKIDGVSVCEATALETRTRASNSREIRKAFAKGPERVLESGAMLFQDGDTRTHAYRVERGAICHYIQWDDGRHEVLEFAFPGDIIGFGHLESYISNAQAMVGTSVSIISPAEFEAELDVNGELAARLAASADREFEVLRARTQKLGGGAPLPRVAAFLLAISEASAAEGWDQRVISDSLSCGAAASLLNLGLDELSDALVALEAKSLIARNGKGLKLLDIEGLEALTRHQ